MSEETDRAAQWLQALHSRGVTVAIRNGRLALTPADAYRSLTDDEIVLLRHHRSAIKTLIASGYQCEPTIPAPIPTPEAPAIHVAPEPAVDPDAVLRAKHPVLWRILHHDDPTEVER